MNIVITGGGGFLGRRLAHALLHRGVAADRDGRAAPIRRITLLDTIAPSGFGDPRVRCVAGSVDDPALLDALIAPDTDSVFHLAAVVSGQAEAEFDTGMRVNLYGSRMVLEACRRLSRPPRVVFTSSVAVYGGSLPDVVADDTALWPQNSYGTQKAIAELLLNDYSRKGYVDGRALRLPTISVRPGAPNKAASGFASGIIREPLDGVEAVCPVTPGTRIWLLSPRRAIEGLMLGHDLPADVLGAFRAINLPGVSVSADDMVAALERVAGPEVAARVRWVPDETIQRIVGGWPARWDTSRAELLGFRGDPDFDAIIRAYIEDDLRPRA